MTDLLTVEEAARALRHSTSSVRRMVRARRLRAYRVAGRVLFKAEDLAAFVEKGLIGAAPKRTGRAPQSSAVLQNLKALTGTN